MVWQRFMEYGWGALEVSQKLYFTKRSIGNDLLQRVVNDILKKGKLPENEFDTLKIMSKVIFKKKSLI